MTMWLIIIGGVVVGCFLYIFVLYNKFIKLNNDINEAFATMDVYLKKRWDLIPNIVETVKGYAKHEADTLEEIVKLRSGSYDNLSIDDKINSNIKLNNNISRIMALAESYPDLKADKHFLDLQKSLASVEEEIAQSRKYFNAVVRIYNNKVEMIPSKFVASMLGYKVKSMFEAKDDERENVQVNLK